ncbi:MAG: hypothetical protein ACRDP5_27110 [Streptosporangiaceae bacterium]
MAWTPQLNITCGRCGKPRRLRHACVSPSRRKATIKAGWSFGQCPKCRKTITNPLAHDCRPKTGYKRRRRAAQTQEAKDKRAQAASTARVKRSRQRGPAKPKHDYTTCRDDDCHRTACVAFRTGYHLGHIDGHDQGFDLGFAAGQAACPREHT